MVSVTPANGFTGTVSIAIMGLPAGATMNPLSPLTVSAGSSQSFTVATTSSTPTGTVALTLHATSGSLAHDVPASLTINPVIQTMQNGTLLFLQSQANGHTARIGLDTKWGGAIVEISLDGTNFVNAHDTGREVQPALYDATAQYPQTDCALYGWDPVLAGDIYDHGSAVLGQTIAAESLYTKTIPIQWCPERFGGGPSMAEPADMIFEQTVTLAPGAALAFQVHYKLTHTGSDTHYNNGQEFPAVYVNSVYTTFARYGDTNPWNYGTITQTLAPLSTPAAPNGPLVYAPEQWAALVDGNNQGLTVYVPGVYPFWTATSFPQSGGSGPTGDATVYMAPMTIMSVAPGAVIEGDIYLVPGDATAARSVVYGLHQALAPSNIVAPLGNVDLPAANASISGASVQVAGWAFGRQTVTAVTIFVDGSLMGATTLGGARPDVEAAYPNLAPADSGWTYSLDTTSLANGVHSLVVHATDSSGNEALLLPVAVVVSN
jgi:Bacterial Ig domain